MENKLPTQEKLSNEDITKTPYMEQREKIAKALKDNLNYIYIVLMIIANCILSLLKIEDGAVGLRYPKDVLGWVMWITQIMLATFIGVMILNAFRRQGIKNGHKNIQNTYNKYLDAITQPNKEVNPRSLKQYLKTQTLIDSLTKSLMFVILNIFIVSVAISANLNALLSLITNIIFAVSFGIKTMLDAEEYVLTELVIWYQLKTAEVTVHKLEPAKGVKNGGKLQWNKRKPRSTGTGRVQPQKKCRAGSKTINAKLTSDSTVGAGSGRVSTASILRTNEGDTNI